MLGWMLLWSGVLVFSALGFLWLILFVGGGAVRELALTLDDLREHAGESSRSDPRTDEVP